MLPRSAAPDTPRRYDFLYRLAEQYGGDASAALLPGMVFSQALARWFEEQGALALLWGSAEGVLWHATILLRGKPRAHCHDARCRCLSC